MFQLYSILEQCCVKREATADVETGVVVPHGVKSTQVEGVLHNTTFAVDDIAREVSPADE